MVLFCLQCHRSSDCHALQLTFRPSVVEQVPPLGSSHTNLPSVCCGGGAVAWTSPTRPRRRHNRRRCLGRVPQTFSPSIVEEAPLLGFYTLSARTGNALVWHSEGSTIEALSVQEVLGFAAPPALQCAIRGAQGVLPCLGWRVRPVKWIYRL